ncbi:MAG: NAD-dependent epimerase/dehydratase family protein [Actinomycetota bacterium]
MQHHVVIGSGPVGAGVASALAESGSPVTIVTRRGTGPTHPLITLRSGDANDTATLTDITTGAASLFNCANPRYSKWDTEWPPLHLSIMSTAERTGAVVVMMDNLYGFGPGTPMPMREDTPLRATGTKGAVRARMATELLDAHAAGRLRATLARASDFYGPGVKDAALGERVVPKVIAGKKVSLLGALDVPHAVSYMPDVVRTLVTIATDERAWGAPWHVPNAPAVSQRAIVAAFATAAGTSVKVSALPKAALALAGLFNADIRELKETAYQFEHEWVADATRTSATFGLQATALAEGAAATTAWWKAQPGH